MVSATDKQKERRLALRGRADLVRIGAFGEEHPDDTAVQIAEALGFGFKARPSRKPEAPVEDQDKPENEDPQQELDIKPKTQAIRPVPFWVPLTFEARDVSTPGDTAPPPGHPTTWQTRPSDLPQPQFLASPVALAPELERHLVAQGRSLKPDLKRTVRLLAECRTVDKLPRKSRAQAPQKIQIVADRSRHLVPIWQDQLHVVSLVNQLFPHAELVPYVFNDQTGRISLINRDGKAPPVPQPETGRAVAFGRSRHLRTRGIKGRCGLEAPRRTVRQSWPSMCCALSRIG